MGRSIRIPLEDKAKRIYDPSLPNGISKRRVASKQVELKINSTRSFFAITFKNASYNYDKHLWGAENSTTQ